MNPDRYGLGPLALTARDRAREADTRVHLGPQRTAYAAASRPARIAAVAVIALVLLVTVLAAVAGCASPGGWDDGGSTVIVHQHTTVLAPRRVCHTVTVRGYRSTSTRTVCS